MPYPNGTYIQQILDGAARNELEQFYSLLQGYLSAEHKENGTHGAVTADSVAIGGALTVGASSTFNGNVIADADAHPAELGTLATAGGNRGGTGVDLDAGPTAHWRIAAFNNSSGTPARELIVVDRLSTDPYAFRVYWDTGSSKYVLAPGTGIALALGDDTFGRLASVRANQFYVGTQTAAVGEWTTFSPTRAASSGTWTGGTTDCAYTVIGKTLSVVINVNASSNSLGTATLTVAIPGGYAAARATFSNAYTDDGGAATATQALCSVSGAGASVFQITKFDGTNFSANTNTLYVRTAFTFEVQ